MEDSVEPVVEPATPAEPKKRKKLTRACDQCSHRKIRVSSMLSLGVES